MTVGGVKKHVVAYMKDFLFSAEQARSPLRVLSGGERGRLMLARALAKPSNLLVLDEPTNDLDLETLDVLEEMLADYAGTVILISHDRDFLDRAVNSVLVPEGEGRWVEYAGGYTDMLAQRGADLAGTKTAAGSKAGLKPSRGPDTGQPPQPPRIGKTAKRRLSFKEKHALESLPAQIAALQTKLRQLQDRLADPNSTPATGRRSRKPARRSAPPNRSSPPPRSAGSSSSCCARRSKARNGVVIPAPHVPPARAFAEDAGRSRPLPSRVSISDRS